MTKETDIDVARERIRRLAALHGIKANVEGVDDNGDIVVLISGCGDSEKTFVRQVEFMRAVDHECEGDC